MSVEGVGTPGAHRAACPECGSIGSLIYDYSRGELVCSKCGCVVEEHAVVQEPEWRVFGPEDRERRSRVGPPITEKVHDKGLTTVIKMRDVNRIRNTRIRAKMARLARLHERMRVGKSQRKHVTLLATLNRVRSKLNLPQHVVEEAGRILHMIFNASSSIRKTDIDNYVAAAIYLAAKRHRLPLTPKDLVKALNLSSIQDVWDAETKIRFKLGIKVKYRPMKPAEYVPRIASKLGLPGHVQMEAMKILKLAEETGVSAGKNPIGMAAAAVYLASIFLDEKRTQKEVAESIDLTEVTVRNRYRDLVERFLIEIEV